MKILAPITSLKDLNSIISTECRDVYICYSIFLNHENSIDILDYLNEVEQKGFNLFLQFPKNLLEKDFKEIKPFLNKIKTLPLKGLLVNSLGILELVKNIELNFKLYIDSGLNIHNLSGIELVNCYDNVENINLTEEIYIQNLIKLKKYSKMSLSIDIDNFQWIAPDIIKSNSIDFLVIKENCKEIQNTVKGIQLIENIVKNPRKYKNKKSFFQNYNNFYYKTNHFSKTFSNIEGKEFKFSENIKQFNWELKRTKLSYKYTQGSSLPRLNLRLTSLDQIRILKKYIKKIKFNPVYSIEYGEILNTADLSKYSFNKIIEKVKKFCQEQEINLQLSTPKTLIERDFDRVYEYVKLLYIKYPYPSSIIINNIGYLQSLIGDTDFNCANIELGQGLNITNSYDIEFLLDKHNIHTIDLSNINDFTSIKSCVKKIKDKIPNKKLTIAGNIRIPSYGLCPLNNDFAILSRLSCSAPCHKGNYAISDPICKQTFPITLDGFCRMHLFNNKILDMFNYIRAFEEIGINEFSLDFSCLPANLLPNMLNKFLNSLECESYIPDQQCITDIYNYN